jgi:hypothetical protein
METIKVKPWGEGQGDHVMINAEDFNPEVHQKFEEDAAEVEQPVTGKPGRKSRPQE